MAGVAFHPDNHRKASIRDSIRLALMGSLASWASWMPVIPRQASSETS